MDINILGPFDVRDRDGREIRLPAGRELSLFALLLVNRGEVVSTDRILEALWGDQPPDTAAKAVQGYVSHLRRVLEPGDRRELLVTRAPGYVLRTEGVVVDATRFEQLAGDGRRALDDGSADEAARVFDEALALWRGPALAEFAYDDFAQAEIHRLGELRLSVTEDRVDALLRLGRHGELVGQLDSLVAAHPLRERLRGQWMLALYRSGRQAEALQAYRDGRRLLGSELGLEPGPELQRLERAILAQDPALEAPAPVVPRARDDTPPRSRRANPRRIAIAAALLAAAVVAAVLVVLRVTDDGPSVVKVDRSGTRRDRPEDEPRRRVDPGGLEAGRGRSCLRQRVGRGRRGRNRVTRRSRQASDDQDHRHRGSGDRSRDGSGQRLGGDRRLRHDRAHRPDRRTRSSSASSSELQAIPSCQPATAVAERDGHVWVGTFSGMAEIDPRSDRIVGRVDLGKIAAQQIAAGRDTVWATLENRYATAVDASSARPTARFYAGTAVFAIARDDHAVWLAGVYGGQLWELDPATGATIRTGNAGKGAYGVALGSGGVWIASWPDHTLVRVDPATGNVLATIPIGGIPQDIAVGDGLVWVAVERPAPTS